MLQTISILLENKPGALLRVTGVLRVLLRYLERVVTHEATFRALADLRVWFFAGVAELAASVIAHAAKLGPEV